MLPSWVDGMLDRFGLTDLALDAGAAAAGLTKGSQFLATQALNIGQNTLDFVVGFFIMLYLLFFLLRDGGRSAHAHPRAIPLQRRAAARSVREVRDRHPGHRQGQHRGGGRRRARWAA